MTGWLKKTFALTGQGAKDLTKAVAVCFFTDIAMILPAGLVYVFASGMFAPLLGIEKKGPGLWGYVGASVVLLALLFILQYIQYNATFLASYTESANTRISLAEHLRRLPMSFFGQRDLADLTTTIMADTAFIEEAFSHYIPQLFASAVFTILAAVSLCTFNWRMGAAVFWVVPAALLLVLGVRPGVNKLERRQKKKKIEAADGIQECLENMQDIKANNQSEHYLKALDKKLLAVEKAAAGTELANGISLTGAQMLMKVGMATTVLTGVGLLAKGQIDFLLLLMYLIIATRIYEPLNVALINLSAVFGTLLVVERMKEVKEEPMQEGDCAISPGSYDITFDHVGFAYHTGETVLKDVSFTAKQGEVTALVGPSGGGKSTAAKLAARFWDVTEGRLTLGGETISHIDPEELLENFSIVFQDVVLFNNTIMENIRIGRKGASDEEVMEAARAAQCNEFVEKLPKGWQTRIGENGAALSGGERQRLSIARALLKDAPIVLLDEATASLDVENESKVQRAISALVKGKTVLLIAHRMRTVAGADKIVVLKDKMVAEQGSPSGLMEQNGIYSHMCRLQKKSSSWVLKQDS